MQKKKLWIGERRIREKKTHGSFEIIIINLHTYTHMCEILLDEESSYMAAAAALKTKIWIKLTKFSHFFIAVIRSWCIFHSHVLYHKYKKLSVVFF